MPARLGRAPRITIARRRWAPAVAAPVVPPELGDFDSTAHIFPPLGWRPFAEDSPWNRGDVATWTKHPNSDTYRDAFLAAADLVEGTDQPNVSRIVTNWAGHDVFHPIYWAQPYHPSYTLVRSPGGAGDGIHGLTIDAPQDLQAADGVDMHLTVIQPDGSGIDFWQAVVDNVGHTITYQIARTFDVTGDGTGGGGTAAGFPSIAGQVTPEELEAGVIEHALFVTSVVGANDTDTSFGYGTVPGVGDGSHVYPANSGDSEQSALPDDGGHTWPPMGAWIRVNLSEAAIDALAIAAWRKTILKALAKYGGFFGDTGGAGFGVWQFQSPVMYTSMGLSNPYVAYATAHPADVSTASGAYIFDPNIGIDWPAILEVVIPPNAVAVESRNYWGALWS